MTTRDQHQPMTDTTTTKTLADLRHAAGMSQVEVAARMGVDRSRVGHLEARYPNVRLDTLTAYMNAIGRAICYTDSHGDSVPADWMIPDPTRTRTREILEEHGRRKAQEMNQRRRASAKELPLQGDTPQPGSDDTGRDVDQADTEGDQRDGGQRQQP